MYSHLIVAIYSMVNLTTAKMIYSWQLRQRKNNYVLSFLFFDIMFHFGLLSSTFHGINRHYYFFVSITDGIFLSKIAVNIKPAINKIASEDPNISTPRTLSIPNIT